MAKYYLDGTLVSASGTGSGTLGDPFGKDDDLLQYAQDQVVAGAGIGATGDEYRIVNGGLNMTAHMTWSAGYSYLKPLVVTPHVQDGTQRVDMDLGGFPFTGTVGSPTTSRGGIYLYFLDFHNLNASNYSIRTATYSGIYYCNFDGGDGAHSGMLLSSSVTDVVGCRFFNDQRTGSLLLQGTNGNKVLDCIFEPNMNGYMAYSYGSTWKGNIIKPTAAMTYNTGLVLTINGTVAINNTFIGQNQKGSAFYINNSYEDNVLVNNYFENIYLPVNLSGPTSHHSAIQLLCGNRGFNNFIPFESSNDNVINMEENNDWSMTESGLVDASSGDLRPNKLLIGAGFDNKSATKPSGLNLGTPPTIGAVESYPAIPRVRDLY